MNIPEILVANGTGAVLVSFLLLLRVRGESKNSVGTELFCRILVVTLLAQVTETISFLLDGVPGAASRFWLYLTNTVCTGATVCVGYAWCLYVDFRVYRSIGRLRRRPCCWVRRCWRFWCCWWQTFLARGGSFPFRRTTLTIGAR